MKLLITQNMQNLNYSRKKKCMFQFQSFLFLISVANMNDGVTNHSKYAELKLCTKNQNLVKINQVCKL